MVSLNEFKEKLLNDDFDELLDTLLLGESAVHVSAEQCTKITYEISKKFEVRVSDVNLIVVGSAKLGFSLVEKRVKNAPTLPRYREFNQSSDIDLAVISQPIFDIIWNELSRYSFTQPRTPWDSDRLGDYFVCGWIRPDHFPKAKLRKCQDWWDVFHKLSLNRTLGLRKVRAGLFYSIDHLRNYQSKALQECINFEKTQL